MPAIPKAVAAPELMPWVRWVQDTVTRLIQDAERKAQTDQNTNASQNSTMTMLVEKLGNVQSIMASIGSSLTLDASQIVSGTIAIARIPTLDATQIVSGTLSRPVNTTGSLTSTGDVTSAGYGTFNQAWNYNVSAITRQAVWMDSSGKLGQTASSERFKKDIQAWSPEEQAVLAMQLVRFHWRPEVGDDQHWEHGLIAEDLHDLGLTWLVGYEEDGVTPRTVHYDRIALAMLPVVQRLSDTVQSHTDRLNDLAGQISRLEARQ